MTHTTQYIQVILAPMRQAIQPQSVRRIVGSGRTPGCGLFARTSGRAPIVSLASARVARRTAGSVTGGPGSTAFLGTATVGTKGQIVIPAAARADMQVKEGDRVVVLRGPREGSVLVFRVDAFDRLLTRAGIPADE